MTRTAVFLDRDGTLIEDSGYVARPEDVRLLPGAASAITRFAAAGHLVVVVSNQSGVARGMFDEEALSSVHERVVQLLREEGAELDGAYYCPFLDGPSAVVEAYRRDSDLRKPKPGMLLLAAEELDIDLGGSWMIGDSSRDVLAGNAAGCRTIRIVADRSQPDPDADFVVTSLVQAVELMEREMKQAQRAGEPTSREAEENEVVHQLRRIHDQIERSQRQYGQQDFSVVRLFGALVQMFAIVAAVWGLIALFDDRSPAATARFALACFLQLASASAFAFERFR